jgi:hypothetical protein
MTRVLLILSFLGSVASSTIRAVELMPEPFVLAIFGASLLVLSRALRRGQLRSNSSLIIEAATPRKSLQPSSLSATRLRAPLFHPGKTAKEVGSD